MSSEKKKILFVCLGNICRSPMGEGVFKQLLKEKGVEEKYEVDSAGTSGYHVGEKADFRMRNTAISYGFELTSRSRKVRPNDFLEFDIILAMDKSNFNDLESLAIKNGYSINNIRLMREFDSTPEDLNVPDPYYGGEEGFENVYQILLRSCKQLIEMLENGEL